MNSVSKKNAIKLRLKKLRFSNEEESSEKVQQIGRLSKSKDGIFKIIPNLYISSYKSASNKSLLESENIKIILNLTAHKCENLHPSLIKYYSYSIADNSHFNLDANILEALNLIKEATDKNIKVLVHCQMGISRAPTIVIAFLIKYKFMSFEDALNLVKNKSPSADPNLGFLIQLRNL